MGKRSPNMEDEGSKGGSIEGGIRRDREGGLCGWGSPWLVFPIRNLMPMCYKQGGGEQGMIQRIYVR